VVFLRMGQWDYEVADEPAVAESVQPEKTVLPSHLPVGIILLAFPPHSTL
jgi:hypothetical protein